MVKKTFKYLLLQNRCPSLSCPLDSLPPGGQAYRGWPAPLPPGGQAVPGNLTPHPGYLHPRGASCPGRFILPPPPPKKIKKQEKLSMDILLFFCNTAKIKCTLLVILSEKLMIPLVAGVGDKLSRAVYLTPPPPHPPGY